MASVQGDDRITLLKNNIQCIEALCESSNNRYVAELVLILANIILDLEKNEGLQIEKRQLNKLGDFVSRESLNRTVEDIAINHLGKAFLLYLRGVNARDRYRGDGLHQRLPTARKHRHRSPSEERPRSSTEKQDDVPITDEDMFSSRDIKVEEDEPVTETFSAVPTTSRKSEPLIKAGGLWRKVPSGYVCGKCGSICKDDASMQQHSLQCVPFAAPRNSRAKGGQKKERMEAPPPPPPSVLPQPSDAAQPALSDTPIPMSERQLNTLEARTCPYCHKQFPSPTAVETHCKSEHAHERRDVYGCSECGAWCVTVFAVVKHWEKQKRCPRGRLMVRDAKNATANFLKKQLKKSIIYTCTNCGKGFVSRLGTRYHQQNVCLNAPAVEKLVPGADEEEEEDSPLDYFPSRPSSPNGTSS